MSLQWRQCRGIELAVLVPPYYCRCTGSGLVYEDSGTFALSWAGAGAGGIPLLDPAPLELFLLILRCCSSQQRPSGRSILVVAALTKEMLPLIHHSIWKLTVKPTARGRCRLEKLSRTMKFDKKGSNGS